MKTSLIKLAEIRKAWIQSNVKYKCIDYRLFNYEILTNNVIYRHKQGAGSHETYNDIIIGFDTETSKQHKNETYIKNGQLMNKPVDNYIVAWSISLRLYGVNLVTLIGNKPSELVECMEQVNNALPGECSIWYCHNLSYDWTFIRKFMFDRFGHPNKELCTKSHYPIYITFNNGIILKDSLILAQRSLEKWADDLDVEHKKAAGSWDYDKIRNQSDRHSRQEIHYFEYDTLALVECIDATRIALNKRVDTLPYTATGIPREEVRKRGKQYNARDSFKRTVPPYEVYIILENVFHGGFTHANRYFIDWLITELVEAYDFASSYPFCMLSEKFPIERFMFYGSTTIEDILEQSDEYAFIFKLKMTDVKLKNYHWPMPALQFSKCTQTLNAVIDNGRILCADYAEIYLTEIDLAIIAEQYQFEEYRLEDVYFAEKGYLPRWFTDYIYQCFVDKTKLKNDDPVLYSIAKARLNSLYGMCVQKCIKQLIEEDYVTGEYTTKIEDPEILYEKYVKNHNSILPYQWGVWVTAYAFRNLFILGQCCETWIYSDTDSCYGINWDKEKIDEYNQSCKDKLIANNYGPVNFEGREYWLGVAEFDGAYSEFKVLGAKRYSGRDKDTGKLKITVAGVPKKTGVECLKDDINNFTKGLIFDGKTTGKLTHTYIYIDDIYVDENGNEIGDSVDLTSCDYLLDTTLISTWDDLMTEEVMVYAVDDSQF